MDEYSFSELKASPDFQLGWPVEGETDGEEKISKQNKQQTSLAVMGVPYPRRMPSLDHRTVHILSFHSHQRPHIYQSNMAAMVVLNVHGGHEGSVVIKNNKCLGTCQLKKLPRVGIPMAALLSLLRGNSHLMNAFKLSVFKGEVSIKVAVEKTLPKTELKAFPNFQLGWPAEPEGETVGEEKISKQNKQQTSLAVMGVPYPRRMPSLDHRTVHTLSFHSHRRPHIYPSNMAAMDVGN
nr:hypothetical protein Iba_chr05cCG15020 [Ipomoea batatas]